MRDARILSTVGRRVLMYLRDSVAAITFFLGAARSPPKLLALATLIRLSGGRAPVVNNATYRLSLDLQRSPGPLATRSIRRCLSPARRRAAPPSSPREPAAGSHHINAVMTTCKSHSNRRPLLTFTPRLGDH